MHQPPPGLWRRMEGAIEAVNRAAGLVGALCIPAAALVVTEGVVVRKVFGWSTIWQIELSVFLLMFACFVGAAYAESRGGHLNVDLLLVYFPPRTREVLLIATSGVGSLLCAVVAWYAWPMWWESLVLNEHTESLWGPPLWIPYLFLPLGMTLLFLQNLVTVARKIRGLRDRAYETQAVRVELQEMEVPPTEPQAEEGTPHG